MPSPIKQGDDAVVIKFGGGLNTRASEDEINPAECADGNNFILNLGNSEFRPRPPFDLIGTVPNAGEVRGFVSLLTADGTVKFAVQADDKVYEMDGDYNFTEIATVSASANLRGRIEANSQVDGKVIITDLSLAEEVYEWDGSTFQAVNFIDELGSGFGTFRAKYVIVQNDRAIYGNVHDNGTNYPHLIVGSKQGGLAAAPGSSNYSVISTGQRPSGSLSDEDPFFLTTPDLRPVNGLVHMHGVFAMSTEQGSMFKLGGATAQDYVIQDLFPRSSAYGNESVVYAGSDIYYGRQGKIESIIDTDKFGDTEVNDLTLRVAETVEDYSSWTLVYNSRFKRVYCFPSGQSEVWVLFKPIWDAEQQISPWSRWVTQHPIAFQPTAVMNALDPLDKLEYTFMGCSTGCVYRIEGSGTSGDAGLHNIQSSRLSGLISIPESGHAFNVHGYIKHRFNKAVTVILRFEWAGNNVYNEEITVDIQGPTGSTHWGGSVYWGGSFYWSSPFVGRLTRRIFGVAGQSNEVQVRVTVDDVDTFAINEIGLRFEVASEA